MIVAVAVTAAIALALVFLIVREHSRLVKHLLDSHRAERFELLERIRNPEARPVAIVGRRPRPDGEPVPPPKDLAEMAKVGVVQPIRDNENGVVS